MTTAIVAGDELRQHSEGIVVSTAIDAGGVDAQHCEGNRRFHRDQRRPLPTTALEGVVVPTAIPADGIVENHAT